MGKLQEIFDKQERLQNRLGYDFEDFSTDERTEYIKEMSIHANQEMNELLYELPFFKPWKKYQDWTEEDMVKGILKAREEYIDFFHFAISIGLALGFTEDNLHEMYCEKNGINHERQDNGY